MRDLVTVIGELESGQDIRAMVLESADPDYFVPHVDLDQGRGVHRRSGQGGPAGRRVAGHVVARLSELPVVSIAKSAAGRAERAANWGWRVTCGSPRPRPPSSAGSRVAPARLHGPSRRPAPGPPVLPARAMKAIPRSDDFDAETAERYRLDQRPCPTPTSTRSSPARRRSHRFRRRRCRTAKQLLDGAMPGADASSAPTPRRRWSSTTRPRTGTGTCLPTACGSAARSNSTSVARLGTLTGDDPGTDHDRRPPCAS